MTSIGVIGLGEMGARMAQRLVAGTYDVTVWNRTASRAEPLAAAGARVATTPAEAAQAGEIVITMVRDVDALREVTEGSVGALAGLQPGSVLIEMSTVGPRAVRELAQRVPAEVELADAPVLGSVTEAEAGSLRIFVGGDDDLFRRIRPVLAALGEPMHLGELGSGAAAKLVANSTLFAVICALGEAVALGEELGLSRDRIFAVLAATPLAAQAERRRQAIESGSYPLRFKLSLARKDAELVLAAAQDAGVDLRLAEAARTWLAEAEESGLGALDYSAVLARLLGEEAS
jgi:3-hydroxyisobutyrate dehydrogenase/2-hydroxy-3-oxopropionate reductase